MYGYFFFFFLSGSRKFQMAELGDTRNVAPAGVRKVNISCNEDPTGLHPS